MLDVVLLGCNAVWICKQKPKFRRKILPPSSGLKAKIDLPTTVKTSSITYRIPLPFTEVTCLKTPANTKTSISEFKAL
jgi:hypothetical protein